MPAYVCTLCARAPASGDGARSGMPAVGTAHRAVADAQAGRAGTLAVCLQHVVREVLEHVQVVQVCAPAGALVVMRHRSPHQYP